MKEGSSIDINDEEKLVLFSIGALGNIPLRSKIIIQKLLFLIANVFKGFHELLRYEPHLYGPYSETVENVLYSLVKVGYIEKIENQYRLSKEGVNIFKSLHPKPELVNVIEDFKRFLNDLNFNELLAFIYVSYPEYISESVKWDELKTRRKDIAISLLRKKKVSFAKASEIAGMSGIEFDNLLKEMGIRWRE